MAISKKGATTETKKPIEEEVPTGGTVPGASAPNPTSFADIISAFGTSANISTAGTEYVKAVRHELEDAARGLSVETRQLNEPSGAILFAMGKVGIVLNFEEAVGTDIQFPTSIVNVVAIRSAAAMMGSDFRVLNCIIVTSEDYDRPKFMADHISAIFKAYRSEVVNDMTIEAMSKIQYTTDIDVSRTKKFVESLSPHKIQSRGDFGFTINMKKDDLLNMGGRQDQYQQARFTPIVGVLAYVEFLPSFADGMTTKYVPIVHITDIVSSLPTMSMAATAISVAADLFIGKGLWRNQFTSFESDKPNIGNLIRTENGQPWAASSVEERDQFINIYCERPVLAIDIVDGRARIPRIELLADRTQEADDLIRNIFGQFLGLNIPNNIVPARSVFEEFVGYVARSGNVYDSRIVDYLSCVRSMGNNPRVTELMRRDIDPMPRADLVREIMSEFRRLYISQTCVLDAELVRTMGEVVHKVLNISTSLVSMSGINMDLIMKQSEAYGSGSFAVTSAMGSRYGQGRYHYQNPAGYYR